MDLDRRGIGGLNAVKGNHIGTSLCLLEETDAGYLAAWLQAMHCDVLTIVLRNYSKCSPY